MTHRLQAVVAKGLRQAGNMLREEAGGLEVRICGETTLANLMTATKKAAVL